ncbi:MAG TPA: YetF domain-containing protein [Luteimonas sp.]|nr:YetF domain-containing protein [Luteimonas sp.]
MSELFELSIPWWEIVLRGTVVYFVLLFLLRLSGKRTVGQFTPFDLLVLVLLGDAMQGSMIAGDQSLGGGIILVLTLLGWNMLVGRVTSRSQAIERLVEGRPVVLARNGHIYGEALDRSNLNIDDLQEAMRNADCVAVGDVRLAVLEKDGKISVVTGRR